MQLPGMATDMVRVTLEITWDPSDSTWGIARREFRHHNEHGWQLEAMRTSATPLHRHEVIRRLLAAVEELHGDILGSRGVFGDDAPPFP